ncbi:bacterial regulatory s, tetR family protein [Mycobacterium xenopi 4042]|uniref:Bacterial regulatory s, tetR family protein n=1 Tax=Mycobacterium xenopi 4042 TaxID=1299334 RepID=X7YIJ9_MYCXE|nr:bacterial regulatory s, tetR family protein [Mycobacterium xenopi 4042]
MTIEAVTRGANVARATLYRHFPSANDLLAAAFNSLLPAAPMPPAQGSLRERLIALVLAEAELIAEAPGMLTAMSWMALGGDLQQLPEPATPTARAQHAARADRPAVRGAVRRHFRQPGGRRAGRDRPLAGDRAADRPAGAGPVIHLA